MCNATTILYLALDMDMNDLKEMISKELTIEKDKITDKSVFDLVNKIEEGFNFIEIFQQVRNLIEIHYKTEEN